MRYKMFLPLLVIPAICLSPGALLRWKIAKSVEARVPDILGPARSYSVSVTGGILGLVTGRIAKVDIHGIDVKLSNGMVVDKVDVALEGVRFRSDQTVSSIHQTRFAASLSEAKLDDFLRNSRKDLRDAKVTLGDGKLSLSARPRVLAIKTPIRADGVLEIVQDCKLHFIVQRLTARGIKVPGFVRGRIMHDINPVMDTSQMGIDAKLESVEVLSGAIELAGAADVSSALASQ